MNELLPQIWHFELFRIGRQPVEVSQCAVALGIVCLGFWLARRVSRLLVGRLAKLPGMNASAVGAIEKLVYYVLLVAVLAVALQTVSIPISAFAVLGGALAIGLGFGAQNLFNNFISGLILLIERPIRAGDLIEVEGQHGHVEEIGARCTRVRRVDGIDMLVPNSRLLENTVTNWTLSDRRVQTSITVRVDYGSNGRHVALVLEKTAREHPRVLRDSPVTVFFEDFASDALVFAVYFWAEIQSSFELRSIASDLRLAVDDACRTEGIAIAVPGHDVRLETKQPIRVTVASRE